VRLAMQVVCSGEHFNNTGDASFSRVTLRSAEPQGKSNCDLQGEAMQLRQLVHE